MGRTVNVSTLPTVARRDVRLSELLVDSVNACVVLVLDSPSAASMRLSWRPIILMAMDSFFFKLWGHEKALSNEKRQ